MSEPTATDDAGRHEEPGSMLDRARAEVDRAKDTTSEVRAELKSALEARRGGPVTTPDEASERLAGLRDALGRDLHALTARAPSAEHISARARRTALLVGGGTAATVSTLAIGLGLRRRRRAQREADAEVERQAQALARALERIQAGEPSAGDGGGRTGRRIVLSLLAVAVAAGAAIAYRLRTAEPPEVLGPGAIDPGAGDDGTEAPTDG